MRFEIVLIIIVGLWIAHIYTDGKYLKYIMVYKKYYKIAGVVLGALFLWWIFKRNPGHAKQILLSSNEYVKYLPIDKNASSMLSPILDFTAKHHYSGESDLGLAVGGGGAGAGAIGASSDPPGSTERILNSGKKATKRSVSETKKKFVASRQNWKCGDCQTQLNAWFEVDHKVRLEYGGSNHIDNLVALCRECHGKKTTIENL
jgi:hypothetical protein